MINLDIITNENNQEHNDKWPDVPDQCQPGKQYWEYPQCLKRGFGGFGSTYQGSVAALQGIAGDGAVDGNV